MPKVSDPDAEKIGEVVMTCLAFHGIVDDAVSGTLIRGLLALQEGRWEKMGADLRARTLANVRKSG